jgi:hypothetical protein
VYEGQSLKKLYNKEIGSITSTDGLTVYTLRDLKELIAFILYVRKPNDVRMLDHKAAYTVGQEDLGHSDHSDHIVSAKLVNRVVTGEKIEASV